MHLAMPRPALSFALSLAVLGAATFSSPSFAAPPLRDTSPDTFQIPQSAETGATPARPLGPRADRTRRLIFHARPDPATPARTLSPRADRTVGIFYFLWQSGSGDGTPAPYDISKILSANPADPQWGPRFAFHFWSEPQFGYYAIEDPWILRKHAQMLTDAGVDVVILDATNAFTYPEAYLELCRVYTEMRAQGNRTPQIAFILNSSAGATAAKLWNEFYSKNLYPELWFRWPGKAVSGTGKPLLLANPAELTPALRDFFTVRHSWAWSDPKGWFGDGRDKWPWLDHSPQAGGWHDAPAKPEQISVAVAEHPTGNIGRSHQNGKQPLPGQETSSDGLYFAEQWRRARDVDPPFVFVTGWNEWIAQRFVSGQDGSPDFLGKPSPPGSTFFVDQYTAEFSRDLEPMRGGWGDAYYYKLVENVRRYKGVRPVPKASAPRAISIAGAFAQWQNVTPEYRDDRGDTVHRNFVGWGGHGRYVNTSGRNDIVMAKLARDATNLYFYVRTDKPLTRPDARSEWMTLLLDTNDGGGWQGYDFAVRQELRNGKPRAVLYRCGGMDNDTGIWQPVALLPSRVTGNEMHLSLPRRLLNLLPSRPLRFNFKWIDNAPLSGDGAFLADGDAAPNGRFRYQFTE